MGRGDGPYGPILPDRFWFQKGRHNAPAYVSLALRADGTLAVRDTLSRVVTFDPTGSVLLHTFAQFGATPFRAPFDDPPSAPTRFLDSSGTVSWTIDAKAGTWAPEAYWGHPPLVVPGASAVGFFARGRPSLRCLPLRLEGPPEPDARWPADRPVREPRGRAARLLHGGPTRGATS